MLSKTPWLTLLTLQLWPQTPPTHTLESSPKPACEMHVCLNLCAYAQPGKEMVTNHLPALNTFVCVNGNVPESLAGSNIIWRSASAPEHYLCVMFKRLLFDVLTQSWSEKMRAHSKPWNRIIKLLCLPLVALRKKRNFQPWYPSDQVWFKFPGVNFACSGSFCCVKVTFKEKTLTKMSPKSEARLHFCGVSWVTWTNTCHNAAVYDCSTKLDLNLLPLWWFGGWVWL